MRRRICIFGDSITWGVEDVEKGGWVDRLKTYKFSQDRLADVYNLGISADTTDDVLARFEAEATARGCDALVFAIGTNDSLFLVEEHRNNTPLGSFEKNLHELIVLGRKITDQMTFIGLTMVDETKTRPVAWRHGIHYTNEFVSAYDAVIKKVCAQEGIGYIPMFDMLAPEDLSDGLHPNAEGHRKMFERMTEAL